MPRPAVTTPVDERPGERSNRIARGGSVGVVGHSGRQRPARARGDDRLGVNDLGDADVPDHRHPVAGKPTHMGLVPNRASDPPNGATHGVAFEAIHATIPSATICSA